MLELFQYFKYFKLFQYFKHFNRFQLFQLFRLFRKRPGSRIDPLKISNQFNYFKLFQYFKQFKLFQCFKHFTMFNQFKYVNYVKHVLVPDLTQLRKRGPLLIPHAMQSTTLPSKNKQHWFVLRGALDGALQIDCNYRALIMKCDHVHAQVCQGWQMLSYFLML